MVADCVAATLVTALALLFLLGLLLLWLVEGYNLPVQTLLLVAVIH